MVIGRGLLKTYRNFDELRSTDERVLLRQDGIKSANAHTRW